MSERSHPPSARTRIVLMLVAAATMLVGILGTASTTAAAATPPPGTTYAGTMSDGGTVTITVSSTGTVVSLAFAYGGTIPDGCASGVQFPSHSMNRSLSSFSSSGTTTAQQANISVAGFWDRVSYRAVAGSLAADPLPGSTCPAHRLTWLAVNGAIAAPTAKLAPNATYSGAVYDAGYGAEAGTARITTDAAGTAVSVDLGYSSGACQYSIGSVNLAPINGGVWFALTSDSGIDVRAVAAPDGFAGAFVFPADSPCPATAATFVVGDPSSAALATSSATPVAAPGPNGMVLTGSIPRDGGYGLIVFGGGTNAQLVSASGCPAATAAFWTTNASGDFYTYVPGTSITAVSADWNAQFPQGIPPETPLLGRCV